MMKKYHYRRLQRSPLRFIGCILLYTLLLMMPIMYYTMPDSRFFTILAPAILGMTLVYISPAVLISYFVFGRVRIWIDDENLVYQNGKRETIIPIRQISRIKTPSINFMGGYLFVHGENGKRIRIGVGADSIAELVSELKEKVDTAGMSHVYDRKGIFAFLKTCAYSDNSYSFMWSLTKKLTRWGAIALPLGILAFVLIGLPMKALLFVSAAAALAGISVVIGIFWHFFHARRHIKSASIKSEFSYPEADIKIEESIKKKVAYLLVALNIVAGIVIVFI